MVTQADREAAADWHRSCGGGFVQHILDGLEDDTLLLKAFARHRVAEQERCAGIVAAWIVECEKRRDRHGPLSPAGQLWEAHRISAEQILTAIRSNPHA